MAVRQANRRAIAMAVWVVVLLLASSASAQELRQRAVDIHRSSAALLATFAFEDLFDDRARSALDNGFWHRVVVRITTRREGQPRPVSLALRTCRVRYELWEEHYEVQVEDHTGRTTRRVAEANEAISLCAGLHRFPVASRASLGEGRFYLEVVAELNPVSEELLESIRGWLRSPQGGHRPVDPGDNFFGSVVSIFINTQIGHSDRMVRFRSQVFAAESP
jgi:hypothetical protein